MIIYGSRNIELAKEHILDKCPHCGTSNSIDMHVFQKYAHVFWIPFFPMGKTGVSQCDHCKQILKVKEMPDSLRQSYENLKTSSKTPVWTFAGIALVVGLITLGIISDKKNDEKNAQLITAPQTGDIFEIKIKERQYTVYKVKEVSKDSVYLLVNNYEVNKRSGIDELKSKDYATDVYALSKGELKKMFDSGEIIDIERK